MALKQNHSVRDLYLAENRLIPSDAIHLGSMLKHNSGLKLLDLRNNHIQVRVWPSERRAEIELKFDDVPPKPLTFWYYFFLLATLKLCPGYRDLVFQVLFGFQWFFSIKLQKFRFFFFRLVRNLLNMKQMDYLPNKGHFVWFFMRIRQGLKIWWNCIELHRLAAFYHSVIKLRFFFISTPWRLSG